MMTYRNPDMTRRKNMKTTIVSNEQTNKIVEALREVKKAKAVLAKQEEKLKQELYNYMNENDVLVDPDTGEEIVHWSYSEGYLKFDVKKFELEKPKVYKQFLFMTEPVRTLRIK